MPSARRSRWPASLRFRLTFWNTVAILVLLTVTLVGVREGLRLTMLAELDRLLMDDADEVGLIVERFRPDWTAVADALDRRARSHADRGWFAQLLDDGDRILAASADAPALMFPIGSRTPNQPYDAGPDRVAVRPINAMGVGRLIVRVGSSRNPIIEDVDRLTTTLLLAAVALIPFVPLTAWWLAGRATRPLNDIIERTSRLHPNRLDQRLPLRGTGDELDRLGETINAGLDRIATHLDRQRDFVANAAHELRSPLTALRSSVEVTLERDRTTEEYREILGEMAEHCQGLSDLINRLLLLAEGEAGRLGPGPNVTDLARVAARSAEMFQVLAEQQGVTLATDTATAPVRGDAAHLAQVVNNLIDNALKFTPTGGAVSVQTGSDDGGAWLSVTDSGRGIAPEDLPRVFDRFFTGDRSRRRERTTGGSGLGLSICRAVVEAYGGHITLESPPGQGTTVAVRLPRADAATTL